MNRTQLSVQLTTLLTGLEEMVAGEINGRGKLLLDACDTAVRKSQELARRIPKGKASERVEKALQQVSTLRKGKSIVNLISVAKHDW